MSELRISHVTKKGKTIEIKSIEGNQVWDRLRGETDPAWAAFVYFRDLGPLVRTLPIVCRDTGSSLSSVHRWHRAYRWIERVSAWDIHIDQVHQKAYEAETKLMGERHARMAMEMQTLGQNRIGDFSKSPILQAELTARDAIALIDTGVKIEKEARATEKSKPTDGSGVTINFNFKTPPWAPKQLQTIDAEVIDGSDTQEIAPPAAAESD